MTFGAYLPALRTYNAGSARSVVDVARRGSRMQSNRRHHHYARGDERLHTELCHGYSLYWISTLSRLGCPPCRKLLLYPAISAGARGAARSHSSSKSRRVTVVGRASQRFRGGFVYNILKSLGWRACSAVPGAEPACLGYRHRSGSPPIEEVPLCRVQLVLVILYSTIGFQTTIRTSL